MIKAWGSDTSIDVASTGIQIHGGMGFIEETGAAQYYRDARITSIYEGTNGIQANDLVGRKIGRENGESIRSLMTNMRADIMSLETGNVALAHIQTRVSHAIDDLERATDWVIETWSHDPGSVAASAVPFLKLLAVTSGGWLMARAHNLALNMDDRPFRASKIATTRFFVDHHVVETSTLAEIVISGAPVVQNAIFHSG